MPREAGGRNNPSHKKERKRERERLSLAMRFARFELAAEQNGLEYESHGPYEGPRARRSIYEWALFHAEKISKVRLPFELLMGSAFGWLNERMRGWEAGEQKRTTKREEAEKQHENNLFEAALKQLHQWVPQPVPDDFECPYTGLPADKRKILATGVKYEKLDGASSAEKGSYLYNGHDTLVLYRAGHRMDWYVARETWGGARDSEGNRIGVEILEVPFGEVTVIRQHGASVPGLPWRGVPGHSGQSGRPILREQKGTRPDPLDPRESFKTKTGYPSEADARKQAMLWVLSVHIRGEEAEVMGRKHIDLKRASRMRGGARKKSHVLVSPPASETRRERPTPTDRPPEAFPDKAYAESDLSGTIPSHQWAGEIVDDRAPHIVKPRRVRKKLEDSKEIRATVRNWRQKALDEAEGRRLALLENEQPI